MLVLSRKPLDAILIGSDIRISIIKIDRNQVRIGIEAPDHVTIVRSELIEAAPENSRANRDVPACLGASS